MSRNRLYTFASLLLLLAFFVRILDINSQSFWIDEGFTWNLSQYADPLTILRQDVHPPLYFLAVTLWVQVTGTSELAMRYFSLLPSILSVAVIFQIAREIEKQRGNSNFIIPLIAAAVMAVAEAETNLSQEARSYTWHVLFACLSIWGFLRWGRTEGRACLALWMLALIALVYTFYLGAFIGVAQGIYAVLFWRGKKLITAIVALVMSALSLAPWLLYVGGEQSQNISRGEVITRESYLFWLDDFRKGFFTGQWALTIGLFVLGLLLPKKFRTHETAIFLLLCFGIPLLLTLILNEIAPTYQPRRVSQIVPSIALLIAFGLAHFPSKARYFLLATLLIYGTFATDFWRFKQPWREMAEETVELIAPNTPFLFELGGDDYAPRYHYGKLLPNGFDFLLDEGEASEDANVLIGLTTWRHLRPDEYAASLPAILDSQDHWWLFYWSSDTGALDWLNNFGFERTLTYTVDFNPDVYLYRYDRMPESPVIQYENGLILRDAILHDVPMVELFWSSETSLEDWTVSVFLQDAAGQIITQQDSFPFLGQRPMSTWQIGETIFDPIRFDFQTIPDGNFEVYLVVYRQEGDSFNRLKTIDGEEVVLLGTIDIISD